MWRVEHSTVQCGKILGTSLVFWACTHKGGAHLR